MDGRSIILFFLKGLELLSSLVLIKKGCEVRQTFFKKRQIKPINIHNIIEHI